MVIIWLLRPPTSAPLPPVLPRPPCVTLLLSFSQTFTLITCALHALWYYSLTPSLFFAEVDVCTICQNPLDNGSYTARCGHVYHIPCLQKWIPAKLNVLRGIFERENGFYPDLGSADVTCPNCREEQMFSLDNPQWALSAALPANLQAEAIAAAAAATAAAAEAEAAAADYDSDDDAAHFDDVSANAYAPPPGEPLTLDCAIFPPLI